MNETMHHHLSGHLQVIKQIQSNLAAERIQPLQRIRRKIHPTMTLSQIGFKKRRWPFTRRHIHKQFGPVFIKIILPVTN